MAPAAVIYAGDIIPAKSILGVLNGTEQFIISNKYFPKETYYNAKYADITLKASETANGFRLKPPAIFIKDSKTGRYVRKYVIAWTKDKNSQKRYFVMKPPEQSVNPIKQPMQLMVKVNQYSESPKEEDLNIAAFEYQALMAVQVVLVANMLCIDLSKYKTETTNEEFFGRLSKDLNAILNEKCTDKKTQPIEFDKEMIESFVKIPTYGIIDKNVVPVLDEPQGDEFVQSFTTFWEVVKKSFKKYIEKPTKYLPDVDVPNSLTKLLSENNYQPIPTFRLQRIIKDDSSKLIFDAKIKIVFLTGNAETDEKTRYPTKQKVGPNKVEPINLTTLNKLWGGSIKEPLPKDKRGEAYEGKMYIIPIFALKYYKQGNPTIAWSVDKMCVRTIKTASQDDYDGGEEYYDESTDDGVRDKQGAAIAEPVSDEDGYEEPY